MTLVLGCWPDAAWAHGSIPGVAGFYWGLLHPFTLAPQLLALLAVGLAIQQRLPAGQELLASYAVASVAGICVAAGGWFGSNAEPLLLAMAIVIGLLVASALPLHRAILWLLGVLVGFPSGYVSLPDPGPVWAMASSAGGAIVGACLLLILLAGGLQALQQKVTWGWLSIAVRIAGSWITAISLLLGALMLRGKI